MEGGSGERIINKSTGLRRLKKFADKTIIGDFFRNFGSYFGGFPVKIQVSEPDSKVRNGFRLISSNFHPNPTVGSPENPKKRHSP